MRRPLLLLALAIFPSACGTEAPGSVFTVGAAREAISGGYIDDKTTGVVGLAISSSAHDFFGHCSGTLLAPNLVLTARHCVALTDGTPNEQVQCGVSQFSTTGSGGMFLASPDTVRPIVADAPTFFRSVEVRVPSGPADLCGHDVALIILAGSGIPAALAAPIEPRLDSTPDVDESFSAAGFGLINSDQTVNTSGTRRRIDDMRVACAGTSCRAVSDSPLVNEWLSVDAPVCPGDSGGPALDAKGRVMGIASRASNCSHGIYGDVSSWRDLIVQTARDAADRGGYAPPAWAADAMVPDAATTTSAAAVGPLGQSCTSSCRDGYACYAVDQKPPGICVPHCGPSLAACPSGYACSDSIGACIPSAPKNSSGCVISPPGQSMTTTAEVLSGLALVVLGRFRRRR